MSPGRYRASAVSRSRRSPLTSVFSLSIDFRVKLACPHLRQAVAGVRSPSVCVCHLHLLQYVAPFGLC